MLKELEEKIGYKFRDFRKLKLAMTHSSYSNEHHMGKMNNNERLEFLGDAVLELTTSRFLFEQYKELPEGELTKKRASMVCEPTLALCAKELDLGKYLFLGKGEDHTGGRQRASITSDAMEALIGAIYLDGGFSKAEEFIHKFILNDIENKELFYDSKTTFQEMVQSYTDQPVAYELIGEEGPDHNKTFIARVLVGKDVLGEGKGKTKKGAEQEAACEGIRKLKSLSSAKSEE